VTRAALERLRNDQELVEQLLMPIERGARAVLQALGGDTDPLNRRDAVRARDARFVLALVTQVRGHLSCGNAYYAVHTAILAGAFADTVTRGAIRQTQSQDAADTAARRRTAKAQKHDALIWTLWTRLQSDEQPASMTRQTIRKRLKDKRIKRSDDQIRRALERCKKNPPHPK
jgi:hypothetical protein